MILNINNIFCNGKIYLFFIFFIQSFLVKQILSNFPQDLDSFLGILFETEECEKFLSDASYLSVATVDCKPYKCDFPYQLCMRPATLYKNEEANQCRDVSLECLTAANNGNTLPLRHKMFTKILSTAKILNTILPNTTPKFELIATSLLKVNKKNLNYEIDQNIKNFGSICKQGVPNGRFCGFQLKYAYNQKKKKCEKFWFPGCRTEETNNNLFDSKQQCKQATNHCVENKSESSVNVTKIYPKSILTTSIKLNKDNIAKKKNLIDSSSQFLTTKSVLLKKISENKRLNVEIPYENKKKDENYFGNSNKGWGIDNHAGSQTNNVLHLIANTIRQVGSNNKDNNAAIINKIAHSAAGEWLNKFDASQFANILQSFG